MDITRFNFEEQLEEIKKVIEDSSFLAIDGEFTGLMSGLAGRLGRFDTPEEYYRKNRESSKDFLLIQFGLCAFKAVEGEKRYVASPYNFYLFPHPQDNQSPDRRFLCQTSSIDFLMSHDFDFNKLFKEGIPYLTSDQEAKMRATLEQKQTERLNASLNSSMRSPDATKPFVVPQEHREFITKIREQVDAYLQTEEVKALELPPCNAFQRRLIYKTLEQEFPLLHIETKTGEKKERFLAVSRCADKNDMEEKERIRQDMERMKLDIQVGFSKVMRAITESGKPVVGHNMYLDVLHSVSHFYGPTPPELSEFKDMIGAVLPSLLDTKLMASTSPFKEYFCGTGLEEVKYTTRKPPFKAPQIDIAEGFSRYSDGEGKYHEAGYDALVTGSCFASLLNFLGRYQSPPTNFLSASHSAVQPFVNKLYQMHVWDIPYVDLAGPDVEPCRDYVYHVTFPEEWRMSDIQQLFEPYGNVQIQWLTGTTAYVGLVTKANAKIATSSLCNQSSTQFQVISYANHRLMLQAKQFALDTSNTSTPTPTNPHQSKNSAGAVAAAKRKSPPPTDTAYPPTKLPRKSLTKANSFSSIPEEDETMEEEGKEEKGERGMQEEEGEEEDVGVPINIERKNTDSKKRSLNGKGDLKTVAGKTGPEGKLFDEPESW